MTLELALFAALFPSGVGHFTGGSLPAYLRYRTQCFFSVWTLYKPYLLLMYQVRQCVLVASKCTTMMLESCRSKYLKRNPEASDEVCVHHFVALVRVSCVYVQVGGSEYYMAGMQAYTPFRRVLAHPQHNAHTTHTMHTCMLTPDKAYNCQLDSHHTPLQAITPLS